MLEKHTKHLIVHEACIYRQLGRTDLSPLADSRLKTAVDTLNILKARQLPTVTVDENTLLTVNHNQLMDVDVLVDNVSAWNLDRTGVLSKFTVNATDVHVYGAFEDICVAGACSVLRGIGVPFKIVEAGTIRLFDENGNKLYPPQKP